MIHISDKKCVACEGGVPPLTTEQAQKFLAEVNKGHARTPQADGWKLEDKKIFADFAFKDFKAAMAFVNKVADLAESEGHHPDIHLTSWNKVKLELTTHAIGGLSENDFILAAKVNKLLA